MEDFEVDNSPLKILLNLGQFPEIAYLCAAKRYIAIGWSGTDLALYESIINIISPRAFQKVGLTYGEIYAASRTNAQECDAHEAGAISKDGSTIITQTFKLKYDGRFTLSTQLWYCRSH